MADYPGSIKTYTDKVDNVDIVHALDINSPQDEITAIETELGTLPKGTKANVKTRLNDVDTAIAGAISRLDGHDTDITTLDGRVDGHDTDIATLEQNSKYACQGRLTLTSGFPVYVPDQLAKTTLYFCPYMGNEISLYSGGVWGTLEFAEVSISLSGKTANTNFDVWGYNNSGSLALELLAWTNNTTRATNLAFVEGVLVKSGDSTRRYLGTIRTTGTTGQCEDSLSKRFVWNMYNQILRHWYRDNASSHTYASTTKRPWNNDATYILEMVFGRQGDAQLILKPDELSGTVGQWAIVVAGYDSTSVDDAELGGAAHQYTGYVVFTSVAVKSIATPGYHYICPLEATTGGSTGTFSRLQMWLSTIM